MNEELKKAIEASKKWFLENATEKSRDVYFQNGKLDDSGIGAVYVYYQSGIAVYVGEASRPIKRRMHDQTSPHKKKPWWKSWDTVKFVNIANQTDRLTLELLLILGLEPTANIKPQSRKIDEMFKT
jgi:hypothetical protein